LAVKKDREMRLPGTMVVRRAKAGAKMVQQ
jgi:hypothetical protein